MKRYRTIGVPWLWPRQGGFYTIEEWLKECKIKSVVMVDIIRTPAEGRQYNFDPTDKGNLLFKMFEILIDDAEMTAIKLRFPEIAIVKDNRKTHIKNKLREWFKWIIIDK